MSLCRVAVVCFLPALTLVAGCGPKRVTKAEGPHRSRTVIALLADSDTGRTGRVRVSNESGAVELTVDREATRVIANERPENPTTLSEADVTRIFGDALTALPPPLRHFTLYFRFESDELTDQSRMLLREVVSTVKATSFPDVVVVGHTDTMGRASKNVALGMKRATMVRDLLVKAGVDAAAVEAVSHGEADPLVPTPDETPEPRNRRVEVVVH